MEKEANISLDKTKEHVFLKTFIAGGNCSMYLRQNQYIQRFKCLIMFLNPMTKI